MNALIAWLSQFQWFQTIETVSTEVSTRYDYSTTITTETTIPYWPTWCALALVVLFLVGSFLMLRRAFR